MTRSQRPAVDQPGRPSTGKGSRPAPTRSRPPPGTRTTRGARTRRALVAAGREVFERDGFIGARVADISAAAGVAHGTFYTYFRSKHEVFREVVQEVAADMAATSFEGDRAGGPEERIESAIRHYFDAYRRNCRLLASLEPVLTSDEQLRTIWDDARRALIDRASRAIAAWQEQGLADGLLDARYAATALGNSVDRFAYAWMVLGEPFEEERAVETLTRICVGALGIRSGSQRRGPHPHRKVS